MSDISFSKPIELWTFEPEADMTPQELVEMFIGIAPAVKIQLTSNSTYDALPPNVQRHFYKRPMVNSIVRSAAMGETK